MSEERLYMIYEYVFDTVSESYTSYKGNIKAMIMATDAFEACEKTGFTDAEKYFSEPVYPEQLKKMLESIKAEQVILKELEGKLNEAIDGEIEKSKICPNCSERLDKKGECKVCKFGINEVAVGGVVVTKKEMQKAVRDAKKLAKQRSTLVNKAKKATKASPPTP